MFRQYPATIAAVTVLSLGVGAAAECAQAQARQSMGLGPWMKALGHLGYP
jgi:hypothetical protein